MKLETSLRSSFLIKNENDKENESLSPREIAIHLLRNQESIIQDPTAKHQLSFKIKMVQAQTNAKFVSFNQK